MIVGIKSFFRWAALPTTLVFLLCAVFSQTAHAQRAPDGNLFSCNKIYTASYTGTDINSVNSLILSFVPGQGVPPAVTRVTWGPHQGTALTNPTYLPNATGDPTLALGPALNSNGDIIKKADGSPRLRMYSWWWGWTGSTTTTNRIKYLDDVWGAKWQFLDYPAIPEGNMNWHGGEVNQHTGEIYLVGGRVGANTLPCPPGVVASSDIWARLGCRVRLGILNPAKGSFRHSGVLAPATPSDAAIENFQIISDMAIDAEGNAYLVVGESTSSSATWRLVRIVPKNTSGGWKYNVVTTLTRPNTNGVPPNHYAMGFLNGKLYIGYLGIAVYECEPLTGACRDLGRVTPPNEYRDFATCQVAPVIHGKIYNDTNGDGVISPEEKNAKGVSGVVVEIWEAVANGKVTKRGEQVTSELGEYSFIVGSTKGTYYIRLKQPQI